MDHQVQVNLCMGSSCFVRGNDRLLDGLERAIAENGWRDKVCVAGSRCENRCGDGPNVFVNDVLYQGADIGVILDVIADALGAASK